MKTEYLGEPSPLNSTIKQNNIKSNLFTCALSEAYAFSFSHRFVHKQIKALKDPMK